jgi:phage/plasmid-associated DNA primase
MNFEYELLPFSPDYYSRNPIPVNFNPEAKCPKFRELIETQIPSEEDQALLQRWMGSVLLQGNAAQRLMIVTGVGATAKSTIVNVVVKLIGQHNVGALRTHLLNERFEIGRFVGKTLLTACDVPGNFLQNRSAQVIKRLTGHDFIPGEVKGVMRPIDVFGDFAMAITCNETLLVRLYGDSDVSAWRRRLLLIDFQTPIDSAKRVNNFADVLIAEEAEGILLFFIEGAAMHLKELKKCGDFILTEEQKGRVERLLTESQSLRTFVKQQIVAQNGEDLTTDEIVKAYFTFCKERKFASRSIREVELELKDLMPEIHNSHYTKHASRDEKNIRGYRNVAFKQEPDASAVEDDAVDDSVAAKCVDEELPW